MPPKTEIDLTPEERQESEVLINELQDRLITLRQRNSSIVEKTWCHSWACYDPDTYTLKFGDDIIVIQDGQGRVEVTLRGRIVVKIVGLYLDLIDIEGLSYALRRAREYMVLDDLANIPE